MLRHIVLLCHWLQNCKLGHGRRLRCAFALPNPSAVVANSCTHRRRRRDKTVLSRRRRWCVLGLSLISIVWTLMTKIKQSFCFILVLARPHNWDKKFLYLSYLSLKPPPNNDNNEEDDIGHIILPSLLFQLLELRPQFFSCWLGLHVFFHHVRTLRDCWLKLNGQLVIISLLTWRQKHSNQSHARLAQYPDYYTQTVLVSACCCCCCCDEPIVVIVV